MKGIWAQPELIVSIINCMKIDELKKYLATFFVNNLYIYSITSIRNK